MTDTVKTWIEERQAIHATAPGETWGNYGSGGFEVYDATEYDDGDMGEMLAYEVRTADIATAIVDAHNNLPRALDALEDLIGIAHLMDEEAREYEHEGRVLAAQIARGHAASIRSAIESALEDGND